METPEQKVENKKALKVFGIESLIILILIIVIVGILSFLGVLPWRTLISNDFQQPATITVFPKNVAKKGSGTVITGVPPTAKPVDPNVALNVSAVSDITGKTLAIEDKVKLDNYLKQFNLGSKTYMTVDGKLTTVPLKNLVFHLTDRPQTGNQIFLSSDKPSSSSNIEYEGNGETGNVMIYISPEALADSKSASQVFDHAVLMFTYQMGYDLLGGSSYEERQKELSNTIKMQNNSSTSMFSIQ